MQPHRCRTATLVPFLPLTRPQRPPRDFARRRTAVELLENRRLLSVAVNETYPGFYQVQGDNSGNVISATVNQNDYTFTLDGTTYTDVSYISVVTGNGNDSISITSVDGSGMIGAAITSNGGDDNITLNFDGAIWTGQGDDVIHLSDSFRGEAYASTGNDQIFISGACVNAEIQGDDGNDLIDCSANDSSVVIKGGAGNDTIIGSAYDDVLYGDEGHNVIRGGGGNDVVYAHNGDSVDGGEGADTLYASGAVDTVISIEVIYT
jgi:Ca2+-binding RTX toxin-like protein